MSVLVQPMRRSSLFFPSSFLAKSQTEIKVRQLLSNGQATKFDLDIKLRKHSNWFHHFISRRLAMRLTIPIGSRTVPRLTCNAYAMNNILTVEVHHCSPVLPVNNSAM